MKKPYSMDRNLLHISYEAGAMEDPWYDATTPADADMYTLSVSPEDAPDKPQYLQLLFEKGDVIGFQCDDQDELMASLPDVTPTGERDGPDGGDQTGAVFDQHGKVWTGPFIMAGINTRTVRRTNALLGYPYGRDFRYSEATITGPGLAGRMKASIMSGGLKLFVIAAAITPLRKIFLQPFLPKPGEGPTREERESGYFNLLMIGELDDGTVMRLRIKGDRDPGYGSTSKMLAETAVCLAKDNPDVPGGMWTPAAALGDKLLTRLVRNAGLSFELE